jgi:translation machinery-associated protein 16
LFFQDCIESATAALQVPEVQELVQEYLGRDDEELAQLRQSRRQGRPTTSREDLLKQQHDVEEKEYESGYWIPDLTDEVNLRALREWRGDWVGLNTVRFVRITKAGEQKESQFPPTGKS